MKHAKLFSILVFMVIALYGAIGFYYLPLASFVGPLTRMGQMPETLFGWTKEQPAVDAKWLVSATWEDADVLVIGDSFSMPHLWQSVLVQRGLKVHTENWGTIPNVCNDFSAWLNSKNFKGRYVVIEVIEHNFQDRLNRAMPCQQTDYHPIALPDVAPPAQHLALEQRSYTGQLSIGIQTQLNVLNYQHKSSHSDFNNWTLANDVRMRRMSNGCQLFSHLACQDVLFYGDDHVGDFDENTLAQMTTISQRLQGITPVWVIVPDKSTSYLHPDKQFWNLAAQRFNAPNVLQALTNEIAAQHIDLYPANETHLSTSGYLLMGETIYQNLHP